MESVFDAWDIIITPTAAIPAFDYDTEGPTEIEGQPIEPARG